MSPIGVSTARHARHAPSHTHDTTRSSRRQSGEGVRKEAALGEGEGAEAAVDPVDVLVDRAQVGVGPVDPLLQLGRLLVALRDGLQRLLDVGRDVARRRPLLDQGPGGVLQLVLLVLRLSLPVTQARRKMNKKT